MSTLGALVARCFARLRAASESPRLDLTRIVEHVLGLTAAQALSDEERRIDDASCALIEALVDRRLRGEPVAYLVGSMGFAGRDFVVDASVLVPRPESEALVERAVPFLRARARPLFCDIGTGSGVLAITLLLECADAEGIAVDLSEAALAVAAANAVKHGVAARLLILHGDLLEAEFGVDSGKSTPRYDLIVANLPYVPSALIGALPSALSFEPRLALDGGPDGLMLYRRLIPQLAMATLHDALILLEAAAPELDELALLADAALPHARIAIEPDLGGLPRFVSIERRR